ncbi:MAG: glycerol-3-phosphate 1-O-acyltransferase PlsY [Actinomycetia bacterium]|nr:glycerol-3-phosphate 1-O-acyltransferase PlsY [Actinomycetes bacterium]
MLTQLPLPLWLGFVLLALVCYLLGGIPFSLIVGKLFFRRDLRELGSGNLGTTNALRSFGWPAGIAVLILDALKGAGAIYLARLLIPQGCTPQFYAALSPLVRPAYAVGGYPAEVAHWALVVSAVAVIVGHAFSPYIGFAGGKAMAATGGIVIAMLPRLLPILVPVFILLVIITRYVSVASLTIAVLLPPTMAFFYPYLPFIIFSVAAMIFVIWLHRSNIVRLRAGAENKLFGQKRGT